MSQAQAVFTEDALLACMRCGFCLSACPTYQLIETETHSPRGRIALMRATHDGKIELNEIAQALDLCLGCRACEPVCPAGVQYGQLLEEGRAAQVKERPTPALLWLVYKYILGKPAGIKFAGFALWLYQVTGLRWLCERFGLLKFLAGQGVADMATSIPKPPSPLRRGDRLRTTPPVGDKRLKIGFFTGCLSDIAFWETNQNAIEVLAAAGCEVEIVPGQGCCGAVHSHVGEHEMYLEQAHRNIIAFEKAEFDYIVGTSGGCGAALKEYGKNLAHDPEWAERARRFSDSYRDFSEMLAELPQLQLGRLEGKFTYQDSCHLRNVQKVVEQPRQLIKAIPGAEYVELPNAGACCGAAGTYAFLQAELSDEILDNKIDKVKGTQAATVVVANAPCQMQMIEGVRRNGLSDKVKVRHIADVLAEAVRAK